MHWMFLPLKRYAEFSGRSRRMEYWMFQVFLFLCYFALIAVVLMLGGGMLMAMASDPTAAAATGGAMMAIGGLFLLFMLAMVIPSIAVTVRRLHDTNRSGWWVLGPTAGYTIMSIGSAMAAASPDSPGLGGIVSAIGMIAWLGLGLTLLVFLFLDGTRGENDYGPDPKGEALDQVFA